MNFQSVPVVLIIASLAIIAHGRSLQTNELPEGQVCSKRVIKAMTYLLVSDYNRITISNKFLYIKEMGEPEVTCQLGDVSLCTISLQLIPSRCARTTKSPFGYCKPLYMESQNTKDCTGLVDFATATIRVPLQCRPLRRQTNFEVVEGIDDDAKFFPSLDGDSETGIEDLYVDSARPLDAAVAKKKWDGSQDGNPHPW